MNAAARLVHQHALTRHIVMSHQLSKVHIMVGVLTFLILFSGLGVIYITHHYRLLNSSFDVALQENHQLKINKTQLLLENSTQNVSEKMEQFAEEKLSMVMPRHDAIVLLKD